MDERDIIVLVGDGIWRIGAGLGFGAVVGVAVAVSVSVWAEKIWTHLANKFRNSKLNGGN